MSDVPPRLYLTAPAIDPSEFVPLLTRILAEVPVACVRLDLGAADEAAWTLAANHLIPVCHGADVPLVITDHFRLVAPLGLDGVHLARARTPVRDVRNSLGPDRIVGAYAGASHHQGLVLAEAGVDYVAFGPVRTEGALGDDEQADDELFSWWAEMIEVPCVAEGGVTLEDATRLAMMADFVVPGPLVWQADDPVAALQAFADVLPELVDDANG